MLSRTLVALALGAIAVAKHGQPRHQLRDSGSFCPPLDQMHFTYDNLPYQAEPASESQVKRGGQTGYTLCNETTSGPDSLCQLGFLNSLNSFCLYGGPTENSIFGDSEGQLVSYCTGDIVGARPIPDGALKGVHFVKTPSYVQVTGVIDQTLIGIAAGDSGGESDPHGADLCGNPIGGLQFSNAWPEEQVAGYTQTLNWNMFLGSNTFCFRHCDPSSSVSSDTGARLCENRLDRIGCAFNMPSDQGYAEDVFEVCEGEDADPAGVYTSDGQVFTYTQPPEGTEANPTYTPRIPASSNCKAYESTALFSSGATVLPAPSALSGGSQSIKQQTSPATSTAAPAKTSTPLQQATTSVKAAFGASDDMLDGNANNRPASSPLTTLTSAQGSKPGVTSQTSVLNGGASATGVLRAWVLAALGVALALV